MEDNLPEKKKKIQIMETSFRQKTLLHISNDTVSKTFLFIREIILYYLIPYCLLIQNNVGKMDFFIITLCYTYMHTIFFFLTTFFQAVHLIHVVPKLA